MPQRSASLQFKKVSCMDGVIRSRPRNNFINRGLMEVAQQEIEINRS